MEYLNLAELKPLVENLVLEYLKSNEQNLNQETWFNLGEAGSYIGVSRNTLKKIIDNGGVDLYVINGIKRISKTQLDEFIKSKGV